MRFEVAQFAKVITMVEKAEAFCKERDIKLIDSKMSAYSNDMGIGAGWDSKATNNGLVLEFGYGVFCKGMLRSRGANMNFTLSEPRDDGEQYQDGCLQLIYNADNGGTWEFGMEGEGDIPWMLTFFRQITNQPGRGNFNCPVEKLSDAQAFEILGAMITRFLNKQ